MKPIQRTDSLTNRRDLGNGVQEVYASEKGGMRKIRCTRCNAGLAVPSRAANGKVIYLCGQCGARFTSTRM